MWQQNCLLCKFGLLNSCQPITGQLIDKTGSNFTRLSVTITTSPKWLDNPVFLPVSLWESPNSPVGYNYDYSQVIWLPAFLPVTPWGSPNRPLGWGLAVGRTPLPARPGKNSSPTGNLVFPSKTYCETRDFFNWKGTFFLHPNSELAHLGDKPNRLQCPSLFQVLDIGRLLPHLATSFILC